MVLWRIFESRRIPSLLVILFCSRFLAFAEKPGDLDPSFKPPIKANVANVAAILPQPDGKLIIGGDFRSYGTGRRAVMRLDTNGAIDPGFPQNLAINDSATSLAAQSDGRIIVGGTFNLVNEVALQNLVRLNSDGSLDSSFDAKLHFHPEGQSLKVVVQSDDKILLYGDFVSVDGQLRPGFARLNANGTLDTGFNPKFTSIQHLAVQQDGRIVICFENKVYRLTIDGSLDNTFDTGSGADWIIRAVAIQSDGRILVAGGFGKYNGFDVKRIVRLHSDGSLDSSFNPGDGPDGVVYTVVPQVDGKVLVGGLFFEFDRLQRGGIARMNIDGTLDSFNIRNTNQATVDLIVPQNDGKILIGGNLIRVQGTLQPALIRVFSGGQEDPPVINNQPEDTTVFVGQDPVLRVVAISDTLPLYQWQFNDKDIPGETNAVLRFADVQFLQSGKYRVIVRNRAGMVTSNPANLSVIPPGPLSEWTLRHQSSTNETPNRVGIRRYAYGNKTHLVVGTRGLVLTSADGKTWSPQPTGTTNSLIDVVFAGDEFLALDHTSVLYSSTNGTQWNAQKTGIDETVTRLAYGNGIYVIVTPASLYTSEDRVSWSRREATPGIESIIYEQGRFVAVGADGKVITSSDGESWARQESGTTMPLHDVTFGNNQFIAVGSSGTILMSQDTVLWSSRASRTMEDLVTVSYGDERFVIGGGKYTFPTSSTLILSSTDGNTWEKHYNPSDAPIIDAGFGGGLFFLLASDYNRVIPKADILTSQEGTQWRVADAATHLHGIAFGAGLFVAVGDHGLVLKSSDGIEWTDLSGYLTTSLRDVLYAKNMFIAVGDRGTILTSSNGTDWHQVQTGMTNDWTGVVFGNGLFAVAGGSTAARSPGVIITSADGLSWKLRYKSPSDERPMEIAYGKDRFISVGRFLLKPFPTAFDNGTLNSGTGTNWVRTSAPLAPINFDHITFGNGLFVAVSSGNRTLAVHSNTWSGLGLALDEPLNSITSVQDTFIATSNGTIFTSTNAATWNQREVGVDVPLFDAAFGNNRVVLVGAYETILQSGLFNDPGPVLMSPGIANNQFEFLTTTISGRNYILESSEEINSATWTTISTNIGNGSMLKIRDTMGPYPNRFYRIRLQ